MTHTPSNVNKDDQPTVEIKRATLMLQDTGWDYYFNVPPVAHDHWSYEDWITYIGDMWFRKAAK